MVSTTSPRRRTAVAVFGLTVAASLLVVVPFASARSGVRVAPHPPVVRTVTLLTGDVVHLLDRGSGQPTITLGPGPDGWIPRATISLVGGHAYVVPASAAVLVAAHKLDLDLFDVNALVRQGYGDARSAVMPLIVDYGHGVRAATRARSSTLASAPKTVQIPALGMAAFAERKDRARAAWRSLTAAPNAAGAPTALAGGATRVFLDGKVHATVDPNVEQIHAPEAWAAGYDGTGAKVAVLDTGYDPTHPDLAGVVTASANFTTDTTVVDGNGHGTHVAGTIAGNGTGDPGVHGGVAPGARLLIGKVLDSSGEGDDSEVLAGMQWAVANGADVVNMSLGGDPGDGTDPLSQAINELSASSKTLFVVAAGNDGPDAGTVTSPGAADAALTVGAVDSSDYLAFFSSRGPRPGDHGLKPDVVAPGVGIIAARAAGTSLGDPVDGLYTSLSGTSMATPHVAGVAAILAAEHPAWDGERIKEAIVDSTDPVTGASAFDAGSGRVDAEHAVHQSVLGTPSIELGSFPYPQSGLTKVTKHVTYENDGNTAVTLSLALESEGGDMAVPGGVSLSASSVTVPAHGTAGVDVVLDPAAADTGAQSGVVDATANGISVRSTFGYWLESEHYDLTVTVAPRGGTQSATTTVGLNGLQSGFYDQHEVTSDGAPVSTTFRVAPGIYAVTGLTTSLSSDGADEGVVATSPDVHVTATTHVVLDESSAHRFDYTVDHPAWRDGMTMLADYNGADGYVGYLLTGAFDRVYATPLASSSTAAVDSSINWLLSQPTGEIDPVGADPVALRAVTPDGARVPALDLRAPVVQAGDISAPTTKSVRKAIAVVAGSCGDIAAVADALGSAGAVALVVEPNAGSGCAPTLDRSAAIPVFEARPDATAPLLAGMGRTVRFVTHPSASYIYDLQGVWNDSVPPGATVDGRAGHVASFAEKIDSLGPAAADGHRADEMFLGWMPDRGTAAYGLFYPVDVPTEVTHYVSPVAQWERVLEVDAANGMPEAILDAPQRTVTAGQVVHDHWLGGPLASTVSPLDAQYGWQGEPYRDGDYLWLAMPPFVDGAGHTGWPIYLDEFYGALYQDGQLLVEGDDPYYLQTSVPPERHDYRLVYRTTRSNAFWQRSTTTETSWEFSSATPADGGHENVPLMTVGYDLPLSTTATAPQNAMFSFPVTLGMPAGVSAVALKSVSVDVSWDGGSTWSKAGVKSCSLDAASATTCTVGVKNPPHGSASLRVHAVDKAGRSVTQTIVDAYAVS